MPAFDIEMSSPMPSGFVKSHGGPGTGGHVDPKNWYIQFGMDFGASVGTRVFAAFDGHVTKFQPHNRKEDKPKVYGSQIFMRAPNNKMGGFYQHLTSVPAAIVSGASVSRGDLLGEIFVIPGSGMPPHLHWALVEIVGGAPGGRYVGVDLNTKFISLSNSSATTTVTFHQGTGMPPTAS